MSIGLEFDQIMQESRNGDGPSGFNLTDMGNAERLVARHGEDLRYVNAWRRWLVWTGQRWEVDDTGAVHRRAKETVREIYNEAAAVSDSSTRKALGSHATKSESESRITAMISLAQSEEGIPARVEEFDSDPWVLNVQNGTLDLKTGELHDHNRADLITKLAPVEYDPEATAPTWTAFLERVLPSEALRTFVQRATGYSLTANTRERILLILYGLGRNGKSTFLEAIRDVLGSDDGYAMKTPAETLMAKPSGGIPNDIARLKGARFVAASETEANRRLAESLVKEITGNDTISARFMRSEWFDFRPTHKVWLATNHKPQVNGTDPAIWDRIKLIPFEVRIPDDEMDPELLDKLQDERDGIFAWAVRGCLAWQQEGLAEPEEVKAATAEYRNDEDVLAAFIDECCVVSPNAWATFSDLYSVYAEWCGDSGERAEKKRGFGTRLAERGFDPEKGAKNVSIRRGIGLKDKNPEPDGPEGNPKPQKVTQRLPEDNPQNTCKTGKINERVTQGYPESRLNIENSSHEHLYGNEGNESNLSNPRATQDDDVGDLREMFGGSR